MIYYDDDIVDEDGIGLKIDLNDLVGIGNIFYSYFNEPCFDLIFKYGIRIRVSLSHLKHKIGYFSILKRRKMIEESHFWLVERWNEFQREKREQPDWYRGG